MRRHLSIALAACLTASLHVTGMAAPPEPVNVFPEGSFEQLEGNAAKGWKLLPGAELHAE